jgi:hypothetical protein
MTDVLQTPSPVLPTKATEQPLSSFQPTTYIPPTNPSLTTEKICLWNSPETMEFLVRMQISEDDVVRIGAHKWPCYDGPPDDLGFEGKTMLQLDREHIMDDETLHLEDPKKMWDVIRQTQEFAKRNDWVLAERWAKVSPEGEENETSRTRGKTKNIEESDPTISYMSRKSSGKGLVYQASDDEDLSESKNIDMDLELDEEESELSDLYEE